MPFLVISFLYFSFDGLSDEIENARVLLPSFSLSLSFSLSFVSYSFEAFDRVREKNQENESEKKREKDFNKNFASSARGIDERGDGTDRERERGDADAPRKELSFSPSHTRPGWLTHHYRQFINSQ